MRLRPRKREKRFGWHSGICPRRRNKNTDSHPRKARPPVSCAQNGPKPILSNLRQGYASWVKTASPPISLFISSLHPRRPVCLVLVYIYLISILPEHFQTSTHPQSGSDLLLLLRVETHAFNHLLIHDAVSCEF
ncbi:hypothetical protein BCV69DRAFT_45452 [Microstroma glucosiphilum]|uniref:Uncharacterized protein n=1 Tax=Pseudomicrostroma glucosiphilum TaxID=1684307 RepID=A0A316U1H2_9BASI|nr:hypothetical protein BCV69DRAFT_45452 [Pseudomicrostroma glucosiphilum]PWN19137.1 hypothetical protein BCV69DRAFT_45452 [Pseudomicrostroma glucosiphilum]